MVKYFSIIILMIFSLVSCAPTPVLVKEYPLQINFEKTPEYSVQDKLANIPKPDKLKPMYVKISGDDIQIVETREEATHILLVPKEYAKIGALLKLAKTYKAVAIEQEALVNTYIAQINGLKELLELERQKSQLYQEMYVESENAYRTERYQHNMDNIANKVGHYVLILGSVALLLFSL